MFIHTFAHIHTPGSRDLRTYELHVRVDDAVSHKLERLRRELLRSVITH